MLGLGVLGSLGAVWSGADGGVGLGGALYNYQENAAQPVAGQIFHTSGANSLKINVVDADGINRQSGITSLRAGDRITIGTQSAYLTGTPGITSGVALVLVDSWPNYTNGQYTVTILKGVVPGASPEPVISGASLIGSTLTCTPGTWVGSPTPTVTRQWHANLLSIPGQTGLTYVTQAGDEGKSIHCLETGTNLTGVGLSASNAIIAASLPVNTVTPVISGNANVGSLLTTTNGTWTGLPAPTFTYHWFADLVATPGIEQTYTIRSIDAGRVLTCVVTGTNPGGAVNATSNGITAIQPPVNLTAPVVTGEGTPGKTLTCGTGTWNAEPAASYTKQWKADGANISGQTANTYVVQAGDVTKTITCAVTATNTGGSGTAISNGILVTAAVGQPPVNTSAPVITGNNTIGSILSLTSQGTWTGTPPINYTYQWQRDGGNTGNTGNSYILQAVDVTKTITCRVTATNVDGVTNASSNGIAVPIPFSPADLFANNEQGAWFDPSDLSTMFQDSAGTVPVTADGQPLGLILDKSKGLVLGSELVTNGGPNFVNTTGWAPHGTGSISVDAGRLKFTSLADWNDGSVFALPTNTWLSDYYYCEFSIDIGTCSLIQFNAGNEGYGNAAITGNINLTSSGTYGVQTLINQVGGAGITFKASTPGVFYVNYITLKSRNGNHASQATAAKRPLYKTSGGLHWLQFDGVDDSLTTAAINFTSTSKATNFVGQASTGISTQMVFEFGPDVLNSFAQLVDGGAVTYSYTTGNTGKAVPSCVSSTTIARVVTDESDVTALTTETAGKVRLNGVAQTMTPGGLVPGGGTFGNLPLYIGSRNTAALFYNGKLYSMIARGTLSTTQEITDTETWVAAKTGVTLP